MELILTGTFDTNIHVLHVLEFYTKGCGGEQRCLSWATVRDADLCHQLLMAIFTEWTQWLTFLPDINQACQCSSDVVAWTTLICSSECEGAAAPHSFMHSEVTAATHTKISCRPRASIIFFSESLPKSCEQRWTLEWGLTGKLRASPPPSPQSNTETASLQFTPLTHDERHDPFTCE